MADENRPSEQQQKQDDTTAAQARPETAQKQSSSGVSADTATEKKIIYSLCYLWGILFFLPLILYKNDAKATRHANEGLLLLLFSVVGNAVFGILMHVPAIGWIFGVLAGIYSLALLILGIVGIVYVVTDRDEELPLIGSIHLLK
ncbi:MAG: hypothetical protein HFK10_00965 [Clostridia bacterium]|jgi:uncharacterized membrane protein|nr:hypothetical protein [Clostridia bacterium]